MISGGMDAEYGNAQSAIFNMATREGGRVFGGEFRFMTDDFGRADKTYTNYDNMSLGFGGPTFLKSLRYYVAAEATFADGENTTVEIGFRNGVIWEDSLHISDIAVYARALSDSEIRAHYNGGKN